MKEKKPLMKQSGPWAALATVLALLAGLAAARWNLDAEALGNAAAALVALVSSIVAVVVAGRVD